MKNSFAVCALFALVVMAAGSMPFVDATHSRANAQTAPGRSGDNPSGNGGGLALGLNGGNPTASSNAGGASGLSTSDPLHPRNVGRIMGFLSASNTALAMTSESSTIGILSITYAGLLGNYVDTTSTEADRLAALVDMGAALSSVANKTVTPELVDAINAKLGSADTDLNTALSTTTPLDGAQFASVGEEIAFYANQ